MIKDTIAEIETRLASSSLSPETRAELTELLAKLRAQVEELSHTHGDHARSIAGFTGLSAHEATRQDKDPELLKLSLQGLASSVRGFEESHPQLVEIVNRFAVTLSNLGI